MARAAVFDPIVVEPRLTPEKVRELVERRVESARLDYKLTYLASEAENRFRLIKHVLAMANAAGGYIVIGVTNEGSPVGLAADVLAELDEAKVRAQVATASSVPIPLFVNTGIRYVGSSLAIVTVRPATDRLIVTEIDGQYTKNGKAESAS
jgi:predicted HTH transcriptional regulator